MWIKRHISYLAIIDRFQKETVLCHPLMDVIRLSPSWEILDVIKKFVGTYQWMHNSDEFIKTALFH